MYSKLLLLKYLAFVKLTMNKVEVFIISIHLQHLQQRIIYFIHSLEKYELTLIVQL